jgi:hypothetical protein
VIHPDSVVGPNCLLMQQVTLGTGGKFPAHRRSGATSMSAPVPRSLAEWSSETTPNRRQRRRPPGRSRRRDRGRRARPDHRETGRSRRSRRLSCPRALPAARQTVSV